MNQSVEQLKVSVQTLALPVTAQLRLHPCDDCRVEELAHEFEQWHQVVLNEQQASLTAEQVNILERLCRDLNQIIATDERPLANAMWTSARWRQIRMLARQALVAFGWQLEVPPVEEHVCIVC